MNAIANRSGNQDQEKVKSEKDYWSTIQSGKRRNVAGRQRTYSQKMTKDALLIYLNTNLKTSLWQLEDTRAKFEMVNAALYNRSDVLFIEPVTTPQLLAQLDRVQPLWNPFNSVCALGIPFHSQIVVFHGDSNTTYKDIVNQVFVSMGLMQNYELGLVAGMCVLA